ncbi:hypothetical protein [Neptunomonas phycophila]|uniref:hypothetical protein n=1 Tax=Neptunomonas phycophila TaxID=1572645 RepID=UPI0035158379
MTEYWRDLKLGEVKKTGDRFLEGDQWVEMTDAHLQITSLCTYGPTSKLTQRRAECVPPTERGCNRYGLDMAYFRETINNELNRPLSDYKPDELARALARLSVTADSSVIFGREFQTLSD